MTTNTNPTTAEKVATYTAAVATYCGDANPANLSAVSAAYAALPAATRGGAMSETLSAADPACLPELLAAHTNLPTATSRVEKATLTDDERNAIVLFASDAVSTFDADIIAYAGDGMSDVAEKAVAAMVDAMRTAIEKCNLNGRTRTNHSIDPTDVIPADSDIVCQYKGRNVAGVLRADNTVAIGDDVFPSLSAAAIHVTGSDTANGWVHWRYNGQKLAALRDAN